MSEGEPNFMDGSDPLFTMYNEMAREEDKKTVEIWKADTDRILFFVSAYTSRVTLRTRPQFKWS